MQSVSVCIAMPVSANSLGISCGFNMLQNKFKNFPDQCGIADFSRFFRQVTTLWLRRCDQQCQRQQKVS